MSSSYSPDLRIELIGTGDQAGTWGATTNNNMAYVLEQAIAGYVSVAVNSTSQALTYLNGGSSVAADNQAAHAAIALTTGTVAANFSIYAPPSSKQYTVYNATSYTATIYNSTVIGNTTAAGTGVAIPAGKIMTVWSDGTNFSQQNTHFISPTLASPTMTTPVLGTPASGTLANCTGLPVSTGISGLGSGVATFLATPSSSNLAAAVSDETGSGALVFATSPTLVTPILGTPQSGNFSSGSFTWPTFNQNTSGNAATATAPAGGGSFITSLNISSQSVTNATNATNSTYASNAAGTLASQTCKAWVNFVGGSASINASYNVSSVTRNSVGDYTVAFTTAMADVYYAVNFGTTAYKQSNASGVYSRVRNTTETVGAGEYSTTNVRVCWTDANTYFDPAIFTLSINR